MIGLSWNAYGTKMPDEAQIELLLANGFQTTFVCDVNVVPKTLFPLFEKNHLECESIHAPFHSINRMWAQDESGEEELEILKNSVRCAAEYGVPTVVTHLSSKVPAPRINDCGLERYLNLVEFAKERGVNIAFENLRVLSNLAYLMENCPDAKFCWDVGHEECRMHGTRIMPLYGKRIDAVHIHDNNLLEDDHMIPFDGKIDFDRVTDSLAEVGYQKSVMLELLRKNSKLYTEVSAEDYFRRAADAARKLEKMIVEKRANKK